MGHEGNLAPTLVGDLITAFEAGDQEKLRKAYALLLAVHPSLPVKTLKELIALARARPNQLSYASSGTGSGVHLATELFLERAGIRVLGVPYKGTGPALNDTVAGHVHMLWGRVASTLPQVKAGRLRGIAVSTAQRIRARHTGRDGGGLQRL